jgi:hypothetical protein
MPPTDSSLGKLSSAIPVAGYSSWYAFDVTASVHDAALVAGVVWNGDRVDGLG